MKAKSLILLVVAGGCGLVAVLGVQQMMSPGDEDPKARILVAIEEINSGVRPNETNTVFKEVDPEDVPEGAITSLDEIDNRFLKYPVVVGDIIFESKLTTSANLSDLLKDKERIATVKVNQTTNHSGLMRPGDRVDVIMTFQTQGFDRKPIKRARTILQYLEIVAVGSIRENETSNEDIPEINAKNVSLRVTARQAQIIELAKTVGQISLSLRGKDDSEEINIGGIDAAWLKGDQVYVKTEDDSGTNLTNDNTGNNSQQGRNTYGQNDEKKKGWVIIIYAGGKPTAHEVSLNNKSRNAGSGVSSASPGV